VILSQHIPPRTARISSSWLQSRPWLTARQWSSKTFYTLKFLQDSNTKELHITTTVNTNVKLVGRMIIQLFTLIFTQKISLKQQSTRRRSDRQRKAKVGFFYSTAYTANQYSALHNLGSGSWLARANGAAVLCSLSIAMHVLTDIGVAATASKHTTAPSNHTNPSPRKHSPDAAFNFNQQMQNYTWQEQDKNKCVSRLARRKSHHTALVDAAAASSECRR